MTQRLRASPVQDKVNVLKALYRAYVLPVEFAEEQIMAQEQSIAWMTAQGYSPQDIAACLDDSIRTALSTLV